MVSAIAAFLLSTLTASLLTPLICKFALTRGLVDGTLEGRKIHAGDIPRLGGIAIVVGCYSAVLAMVLTHPHLSQRLMMSTGHLVVLLTGGLVIAALGLYDDLYGADAKVKFSVQFVIAAALFAFGFRIQQLSVPWIGTVSLSALSFPITLLWIVGVTNAMNLIDGLDGLAGGVSFIAIAAVFAVAMLRLQPLMMVLSAALGGAVLGFLFYNFNPASIFMGDTGSMFLGFMLATSAISAGQKSSTAVAVTFPLVLLAIPILDTLAATGRRAARGHSLFRGDREHIHHRLLAEGYSQRKAVLLLYAVCCISALSAIVLFLDESAPALAGVAVALALTFLLLSRRVGLLPRRRPAADNEFDVLVERAATDTTARLRNALPGEIWSALHEFGRRVHANSIRLMLVEESGVESIAVTNAWQPHRKERSTGGKSSYSPIGMQSKSGLLIEWPYTTTLSAAERRKIVSGFAHAIEQAIEPSSARESAVAHERSGTVSFIGASLAQKSADRHAK